MGRHLDFGEFPPCNSGHFRHAKQLPNSKNELTANGLNSLTFDNDGNTLSDGSGQTYCQ